jgi:hypothetical protein
MRYVIDTNKLNGIAKASLKPLVSTGLSHYPLSTIRYPLKSLSTKIAIH